MPTVSEEVYCPACRSNNVENVHHRATPEIDECDFLQCEDCGYQWNFE